MAEVDASIYNNIKLHDPLETVRNWTDIGTAMTNNRLLQMQLQGKQAVGRAAQGAIGSDGSVDPAVMARALKDDPSGWAGAAEGGSLALDQTGKVIANTKAGLDVNQQNFDNIGNAWGMRLAQGGDVTPRALADDVTDLLATKRITPAFAKDMYKRLAKLSPEQARAYASGGYLQSLEPGVTSGAAEATPGTEGEPRKQTGGQFIIQSLGLDDDAKGVRTGIGPSEMQARGGVGTGQAAAYNAIIDTGRSVPDRKAMLMNMSKYAKGFTGGPYSEEIKNAIAGFNQLFGTKINAEGVASQEQFEKLANQIAIQQASIMNASDQSLVTAMGANPNSKMSPLGVEGVIATNLGNEDAIAVKANELANAGIRPDQLPKWSADWNKNYDPRVFQSVYLGIDKTKQMIDAMPKTERQKFRDKYNYALKRGWIPDPRIDNAQ